MKKNFSLMLIICLGFSTIFNTSFVLAKYKDEMLDRKYYEVTTGDLEIYSEAILSSKYSGVESNKEVGGPYSDNYAGSYIDDQGLLNICFVDDLQLLVKNFYINNFIKKLKYCSCFCKNLVL